MPVTGGTNLVASMSIAGIPPFNGFWSKLIIILAAVQAERYGYAFWAVLASVLTLASFMKVMRYAFQGSLPERWNSVREAPFFMGLAMTVLALLCVAGGLLLLPQLNHLFAEKASGVLLEGVRYASAVLDAL